VKTAALTVVFLSLTAFAQTPKTNLIQMAFPDAKGVLEFDAGPTTPEIHLRPDGKEVQLKALDRPDKLNITAFLQRVPFPASPERCRDAWWPDTKKAPVRHDDLHETEVKDGIARVEFIIPEFRGMKVRQKDIHAYLGGGDLCAEIHLSKILFEPKDKKLFEDLLATAKLLPDAIPSAGQSSAATEEHDGTYYFVEATKLYRQEKFTEAADLYLKAMEQEHRHRTLSKDLTRVLIDNLGMSYGMSGKLGQAEATFVYGLTQDPEYPMFHYNLACYYGETNKMDDALAQLRLAYKYKANSIPGEGIPDPLKDDSFRHFVGNEEFVKAVHEMRK
jgi:tetratricopeptide (TPR) repeat protein